jgi:hypothetical protein
MVPSVYLIMGSSYGSQRILLFLLQIGEIEVISRGKVLLQENLGILLQAEENRV